MSQGISSYLRMGSSPPEGRVHVNTANAVEQVAEMTVRQLAAKELYGRPPVLLCIGSDRSIGDSLGPLVGSFLKEAELSAVQIHGTLEEPVHAANLGTVLSMMNDLYRNPLIIAVDACLGRAESVGMLTLGAGSLTPGAGVNKSLPAVGDLYATGVVNVGGFMEYFVLQNTRLSLVVKMARVLADGLRIGLERTYIR